MLVKAVITLVAVLPFRLGGKTTVFTSPGMIQIGEFGYVLARAGREAGAMSETLHSLILTSSLLTIVLTPAAFWIAPRVDLALARVPLLGRLFSAHSLVLGEEAAFAGHAIVAGYGRVGRRVTADLRAAGLTVVVIEQDFHLVEELSRTGIPAVYGDASYQSIMTAVEESARLLEQTEPLIARYTPASLSEGGTYQPMGVRSGDQDAGGAYL